MSMERDLFRTQAKKFYKEQVKNVPKRNRMPFSEFFKQYKKMKTQKQPEMVEQQQVATPEVTEDFDITKVVNVNKIEEPDKEK